MLLDYFLLYTYSFIVLLAHMASISLFAAICLGVWMLVGIGILKSIRYVTRFSEKANKSWMANAYNVFIFFFSIYVFGILTFISLVGLQWVDDLFI